jgi:SAM-dependent methyltransferase
MTPAYSYPALVEGGAIPCWEGNGFKIEDEFTQVLQYSMNESGWNDDLTEFHEEAAGDQHFIDKASRDYAISELSKHIDCAIPSTILEVGCSSGFMLQRMQITFPNATIIGSDVVNVPLQKLANTLPGVPLLRFDLTQCPLPSNSVDGIVMLNVLEHIEDDALALQQVFRILKPKGVLIIEVPAGPHLYDAYDKVLKHYRRYDLANLRNLVMQQGFKIQKKSHLGFLLYPGFWLTKQRNKRLLTESAVVQRQQVEKVIRQTGQSKFLHALMQSELYLGKWISYPFGIRCLLSCTKEE